MLLPAQLSMHVFMTTDAVGGVWTYSIDLAQGLAANGVSTTLAVLGPRPSAAQCDQAAHIIGLRLIEAGCDLDWQAQSPEALSFIAQRVSALVRENQPDIVHLNSPSLAAMIHFHQRCIGVCHSCPATWWEATQTDSMPANLRWQMNVLARGYANCDVLVAPTFSFAESTKRTYGVNPVVVRNGRSDDPEPPAERERCVLTAGRLWDCAKNLAALDRAAAKLDAPIYAAGPLQMKPGGRISPNYIKPLGPLSSAELRARMQRSLVFASMAVYEPFGLSVLEAALAGCALVLSDIASFHELWSGAATFVPPNDAAQCARVLTSLLDNPELAAEWGAAAKARSKSYSVAAMAHGMLDIYRKEYPHSRPAA